LYTKILLVFHNILITCFVDVHEQVNNVILASYVTLNFSVSRHAEVFFSLKRYCSDSFMRK